MATLQRQEIGTTLAGLDPLARQVVGWRFGLADGVPYTPDEVATLLRLPLAAVQQIEATALATLRAALTTPAPREGVAEPRRSR